MECRPRPPLKNRPVRRVMVQVAAATQSMRLPSQPKSSQSHRKPRPLLPQAPVHPPTTVTSTGGHQRIQTKMWSCNGTLSGTSRRARPLIYGRWTSTSRSSIISSLLVPNWQQDWQRHGLTVIPTMIPRRQVRHLDHGLIGNTRAGSVTLDLSSRDRWWWWEHLLQAVKRIAVYGVPAPQKSATGEHGRECTGQCCQERGCGLQ